MARKFNSQEPPNSTLFVFHVRNDQPTNTNPSERELFRDDTDLKLPTLTRYRRALTMAVFVGEGWSAWGIGNCGLQDQFCRRIGRSIAVGRAKKSADRNNIMRPTHGGMVYYLPPNAGLNWVDKKARYAEAVRILGVAIMEVNSVADAWAAAHDGDTVVLKTMSVNQ